jgi:hypothetical protein
MKASFNLLKLSALAVLATVGAIASAAFQPLPDIGAGAIANDINGSGTIIGAVVEPATYRLLPVKWENGTLVRLSQGIYDSVVPQAISPNGIIVGRAALPVGAGGNPVVWVDGEPVELPTLGEGGQAVDVNSNGWIVGDVKDGENYRPALWINGNLTVLDTPAIGVAGDIIFASARSINESGEILGTTKVAFGSDSTVVRWTNGALNPLALTGFLETQASRVSNDGSVLFFGYREPFYNRGVFVASPTGAITQLGLLENSITTIPMNISEGGTVIGYSLFFDSNIGQNSIIPTVWKNGVPTALQMDAPYRYGIPTAATDDGKIVGYISDPNTGASVAGVWSEGASGFNVPRVKGKPGQKVNLTASVLENGRAVVGKEVKFMIQSKLVGTAKTNSAGIAKLPFTIPDTMPSGSMELMGNYNKTRYAKSALDVEQATVTLTARGATGAAGTRVSVTGTLRNDASGLPLSGQTLRLKIGTGNGVVKTATNGTYTVPVSIPAGAKSGTIIKVEVNFAATSSYKAAKVTVNVTVR